MKKDHSRKGFLQDIRQSNTNNFLLRLEAKKIFLPSERSVHKKIDTVHKKPQNHQSDLLFEKNTHTFEAKLRTILISPFRSYFLGEMRHFGAMALVVMLILTSVSLIFKGWNLQKTVQSKGTDGYQEILKGVDLLKQNSLHDAHSVFQSASNHFDTLQQELDHLSVNISAPYFDTPLVQVASDFSDIAKNMSLLAAEYTRMADEYSQHLQLQLAKVLDPNAPASTASFTETLKHDLPQIEEGKKTLETLLLKIEEIRHHKALPSDIKNKIISAELHVKTLHYISATALDMAPALLEFLGDNEPHRGVVMFQNSNEIRPTGGFMGSFVFFEFSQGNLTQFRFQDIYDIDNQIDLNIEAPVGLKAITPLFSLRDANYYPHFPRSAEEIMYFFPHGGGSELDTVAAIDQKVLFDLFPLIGKIDLPGYPISIEGKRVTINGTSFETNHYGLSLLFSYIVESHLEDHHTPKNILAKLIPIIADNIQQEKPILELSQWLQTQIHQKNILAYSQKPIIQDQFRQLKVTGETHITEAPTDYLMVIDTSFSGSKSNFSQHISHATSVSQQGKISNTLTLYRKHHWTQQLQNLTNALNTALGTKKLEYERLNQILGDSPFRSYTRIYLPADITLDHVSGLNELEVVQKDSKTVISGFPEELLPGEEQFIKLEYTLPLPLSAEFSPRYQLVVQKQAGRRNDTFTKILSGESLKIIGTRPQSYKDTSGESVVINNTFESDMVIEVMYTNK